MIYIYKNYGVIVFQRIVWYKQMLYSTRSISSTMGKTQRYTFSMFHIYAAPVAIPLHPLALCCIIGVFALTS